MIKRKQLKLLMGLGIILVPSMVMGKTTATVISEMAELTNSPVEKQKIVKEVLKGSKLQILDVVQAKENEVWYEVALEEEQTAFILQEHLNIIEAKGSINVEKVEIKSYPDHTDSTIMGYLEMGEQVRLLYKVNDFYKVYVNGQPGFIQTEAIDSIYKSYIKENTIVGVRDLVTGECKVFIDVENSDYEKENVGTVVSSKGDQIVETAMKYLGTPYAYGGSSLTKGVDCSGFTQGVMKLMGIQIPRTSKAQSQTGTVISVDQLQKGDLLFFGTSKSNIFHTGIYIGDGKMIHSSTAKSGGVIIANAYTGGGAPLQVIRRVH